MKRSRQPIVLLGLLAMTVCSGCQTFGNATIRGQSPMGANPSENGTKIRGPYHTPIQSAADGVYTAYQEHHNTTTSYYGPNGPTAAGYNCPPQYAGGSCPPGYGNSCPPGGAYGCPPGHHGCRSGLGHDKFSYGYEVPNDLVYPPAGGIGGAVVYPYYTHKGPSDFFRQ